MELKALTQLIEVNDHQAIFCGDAVGTSEKRWIAGLNPFEQIATIEAKLDRHYWEWAGSPQELIVTGKPFRMEEVGAHCGIVTTVNVTSPVPAPLSPDERRAKEMPTEPDPRLMHTIPSDAAEPGWLAGALFAAFVIVMVVYFWH